MVEFVTIQELPPSVVEPERDAAERLLEAASAVATETFLLAKFHPDLETASSSTLANALAAVMEAWLDAAHGTPLAPRAAYRALVRGISIGASGPALNMNRELVTLYRGDLTQHLDAALQAIQDDTAN